MDSEIYIPESQSLFCLSVYLSVAKDAKLECWFLLKHLQRCFISLDLWCLSRTNFMKLGKTNKIDMLNPNSTSMSYVDLILFL